MSIENNNDLGDSNKGKWKGRRKDRDDTPSFIRDVKSKREFIGPDRTSSSSIPVLVMPSSIKMWQKVRWPLFVTIVLAVLVTVGVLTHNILVTRNLERRVEEAGLREEAAQVGMLLESNETLASLAKRYPKRMNVQAAYAWNSVLLAQLFGPAEEYLSAAADSLESISSDRTALGFAARAGKLAIEKRWDGAFEEVEEGIRQFGNEPRLHLVKAWILIGRDQDSEEGIAALYELRKKSPGYLPSLYSLISVGLEKQDRLAILNASSELLAVSSGNLYGALTTLLVRLPKWTDTPLSQEDKADIVGYSRNLKSRLNEAPEKLKILAAFLFARVDLISGQYERAAKAFKKLVDNGNSFNALAWYGRAVRQLHGPRAALAAVESAGDNPGPEIADLRVRCYLDEYQVDDAEKSLAVLKDEREFDLAELNWILAVRKGDHARAKETLPDRIDGSRLFLGLEMYDLLQSVGDKDGIDQLTNTMVGEASACADGIQTWHSRRIIKTFSIMQKEDPCYTALGLRVMQDHYPPDVLKEMADRIAPHSEGNMRLAVDRALALWKTHGREQSAAMLKALLNRKPQGIPLLTTIARAYLKMGLYDEAVDSVRMLSHPVAISIQIEAYRNSKQSEKGTALLKEAKNNPQLNTHPALVYWLLEEKYQAGDVSRVVENADEILDSAGVWTAKIAEVKAKALNAMGSRGDADRFLMSLAKKVIPSLGLNESWDIQKALIRLNLRRGGAFLFKAVAITLELYKGDVKDPEVVYSYGVEFMRQGNERGALRFFQEAIELDPTFVPAYEQLNVLGKLTPESLATLQKMRPGITL